MKWPDKLSNTAIVCGKKGKRSIIIVTVMFCCMCCMELLNLYLFLFLFIFLLFFLFALFCIYFLFFPSPSCLFFSRFYTAVHVASILPIFSQQAELHFRFKPVPIFAASISLLRSDPTIISFFQSLYHRHKQN